MQKFEAEPRGGNSGAAVAVVGVAADVDVVAVGSAVLVLSATPSSAEEDCCCCCCWESPPHSFMAWR